MCTQCHRREREEGSNRCGEGMGCGNSTKRFVEHTHHNKRGREGRREGGREGERTCVKEERVRGEVSENVHMYMYVCMSIFVCVYMCMCVHVCVYMCKCVHV